MRRPAPERINIIIFKSKNAFTKNQIHFFSEEKIPVFDIQLKQKDILNSVHDVDYVTVLPTSKQ